jgi:hypothetical protein
MTASTQQTTEKRAEKRKSGLIFPSVKNKPSPANTTFATELLANIKDVKVRSGRVDRFGATFAELKDQLP